MPVAESELVKKSPQTPIVNHLAADLNHLRLLEAESIHILREVASEFERPVMLYSIPSKDSSVMLRAGAERPSTPRRFPSRCCTSIPDSSSPRCLPSATRWHGKWVRSCWSGATSRRLRLEPTPSVLDTKRCCGLLKTQALLDALRHYKFE